MKRRWRRVGPARDGTWEYRQGDQVLATVRREDPPGNSHFSLWTISDQTGHEPTLREAKLRVQRKHGPPG